jgi:hypothetical protein
MKIYNEPKNETKELPCSVNGIYLTEDLLVNSRESWAKKGVFELTCDYLELIAKFELNPEIEIIENIASYKLTDAESYLIEGNNWHDASELKATNVIVENASICVHYWLRFILSEAQVNNSPLVPFFEKTQRFKAPYFKHVNGGTHYFLYLNWVSVSDNIFSIDDEGVLTCNIEGVVFEQLAAAEIITDKGIQKIVLK